MSEVEKLADRLVAEGVLNMHVSWGPDAEGMDAEQRAKVLNDIHDELAKPHINLASRLGGMAFLLRDRSRVQTDIRTMREVELTPAEHYRRRTDLEIADLLEQAEEWIGTHP